MIAYIVRRVLAMIPTLFIISIITFIIIDLPPGDYLDRYIAELQAMGVTGAEQEVAHLRERYALDKPVLYRYFNWLFNIIRGDFGISFAHSRPVKELIGERLLLTIIISGITIIFTWVIAIPVGIYSATHQYKISDYVVTFFGFLGLSIPNFLLALILMVAGLELFGRAPVGLFSPEFELAHWSWAKVLDMLKNIWVPVIIVGLAGTASLIRIMRANLLDVLRQPYIQAARCKGLSERVVIYKHAVRNALHPLVMQLGLILPRIISGEAITSMVLNLPTTGPLYLQALQNEDMYLAGSFLFFITVLLLIGNLLSDILLALLDPRIQYD